MHLGGRVVKGLRMPVHVVTDSVASIPANEAKRLDIDVVSLYINDGLSTEADLDIDLETFYPRLADMSRLPTSSQPSVESFIDVFRGAVERGSDVVGIFISEKMSGTAETARMAAEMVRSDLPAAQIHVVDSRSNSMQEGFAAIAAATAAQAGETAQRCIDAAQETMKRTRYLFTPHTLEYLRRGGRIGAASALVGSLLQIRPILTVSNGETTTFAKVRSQGRALTEMARQFDEDIRRFGLKQVVVHYISDRETAEQFAREQVAPLARCEVRVVPVSPAIGVHVGPAVGLVYETEREIA